jgi:hypothetical protein
MRTTSSVSLALAAALAALAALLLSMAWSMAADEPTEATINKPSIQITTGREIAWHAAPKGSADEQWDVWKWTPRIKFTINGPVEGGSQMSVVFTQQGGKPWVTFESAADELSATQWEDYEYKDGPAEGKGLAQSGEFGVKILLRKGPEGQKITLFTGKLVVKRFHYGNDLPKFKDDFLYYVDQDWRLPIGYVWYPRPYRYASGATENDQWASLHAAMWFRSNTDTEVKPGAYLYYQGKQIGSTEGNDDGTLQPAEGWEHIYRAYKFIFTSVLAVDKVPDDHRAPDYFHLEKNPGEYEIKVMISGKLMRRAKFTVDADGKITDGGLSEKNKLGSIRMIAPVQIVANEAGTPDLKAWKTGAFYGNPLEGFTAP